MRKSIWILFAALAAQKLFGQQALTDSVNIKRQKINKTGLAVLGSWSAANVIYGAVAAGNSSGSTKYFHQMNSIWNGVTLGIAAFGYFNKSAVAGLSLQESIRQQHNVEKVFLLNAGLDVAYMAGGFFLKEKSYSTNNKPERLEGYGNSIILQGGVLLLFDGVMYLIYHSNGKRLFKLLEKVQLTLVPNNVGVNISL